MSGAQKIEWMILGVLALLAIKYLVFGLNNWDATFHPMRKEDPNSQFLSPMMGIF